MSKENVTGREAINNQDKAIKDRLARIKNKIIVMSGKGGVGKSSVAVNLAVGLSQKGLRVGLLDIDVHGPSLPKMLGVEKEKIQVVDKNIFIPVNVFPNLKLISIGFFLDSEESALIWRGPRKTALIRQFISDVEWSELDYLIIDSPPGTGDELLTVAQTIKESKAVIVTTPQELAILDVKKAVTFCNELGIKITGIVENMSGMFCPKCGEEIEIFKKNGGFSLAQYMEVPFLGYIGFFREIVEAADEGMPVLVKENISSALKESYETIIKAVRDNSVV